MTNQEAIKVLSNFDMQVSAKADGAYQSTIGEVACKVAIAALEKQIPKIPYTYGDGYADGYPVIDMYECPNCGETYEIECDHYDYCPKCGRHMDKSDKVFE